MCRQRTPCLMNGMKIPCAADQVARSFTGHRNPLHQSEGTSIDRCSAQFFNHAPEWIGRDPNTLLKAAEALLAQTPADPCTQCAIRFRNIKDHPPPLSIPLTSPAGLGIGTQPTDRRTLCRQPNHPLSAFRIPARFQIRLVLKPLNLPQQSTTVCPGFKRRIQCSP